MQWPPVVDVVNARELPPVLIERYNAAGGQGTALCGIFPAIRRAWATVDDTLFLWRFDKWYSLPCLCLKAPCQNSNHNDCGSSWKCLTSLFCYCLHDEMTARYCLRIFNP